MSQQVLREAIKQLEGDLKGLASEMKKKKQAINVLYETLGEPTPYQLDEDSKVLQRDQFYAKPFASAASEFLKLKGHASTAEEILRGLEEGGFDFPWRQNDQLRSVAVSLGKNVALFRKLPNNTYGLVEWYINKPMRRTRWPGNKSINDEGAGGLGEQEGENQEDSMQE